MTGADSLPLTSGDTAPTIEGITELSVLRYFQTFNAGNFQETAALFAANGQMLPPFESLVEGRSHIATYLQTEAQGMKLHPRSGISQPLENGQIQVQVCGKVDTSWCGVNVSWLFILNSEREILSATIKLLASPQELLSLRR